jgi:hypothetical protein
MSGGSDSFGLYFHGGVAHFERDMRPFRGGLMALFALAAIGSSKAAITNSFPDFQEVRALIRAHLPGVGEAELNRAALEGLLSAFAPRISLVPSNPAAVDGKSPLVSASVYASDIACLRVGCVGAGLVEATGAALRKISLTNRLGGLVLDLRYASGDDYAAAAAVADMFTSRSRPLLNWGGGMRMSQVKTNALRLPVALLVNRSTSGAAEALAGTLRQLGCGLLLGQRTAGSAVAGEDYPLQNGGQLRIATIPVQLGDGTPLPAAGLLPDILVPVAPDLERKVYDDPFAGGLTNRPGSDVAGGTNSVPARARLNEAALVREHRAGLDRPVSAARAEGAAPEVTAPEIRDLALARAVDLLKALALVRPATP